MKIVIFTLILGWFFTSAWASEDWSSKPIIDEEFKAQEIKVKADALECRKKEKNLVKRMRCVREKTEEIQREGNLRGTEEYCRKHYGHLKYEELFKLWEKRREQRSRARDPIDRLPGELSRKILKAEESWLHLKIVEIRQSRRLVE